MPAARNSPVDELLAKLNAQQETLARKKRGLAENENTSSSSSAATDPYATTPPTDVANSDGRPDAAEVFRLKKELELAKERMAQMDLQLTQSRLAQHTMEEAIGSPFPAAQHLAANIPAQAMLSGAGGLAQAAQYNRAAGSFSSGGGSFNMAQQS